MRALDVVDIIHDAIKEAGEDGIPSGHLYALLTGVMSLHTYQSIIDLLTETGKVTCKGWLLKVVK